VVVVNRTPARGASAAGLARAVGRAGSAEEVEAAHLVVNATPVGMAGVPGVPGAPGRDEPGLPGGIDPARLGTGQLVVDLVYEPRMTPLLRAAEGRGAATAGGLGMLVHQAGHAFRLWTGEEPPLAAMREAVLTELKLGAGTAEI
jgi:shikimate dehydrogenase